MIWAKLAKAIVGALGVTAVAVTPPDRQADPRVLAFSQAYGPFIDSIAARNGDVVFYLRGRPIHFQDGRMLADPRASDTHECDSVFYPYSLEPLTEPVPAPEEMPVHCTDVPKTLWGVTESEIREHGRSIMFLDHRMFVNEFIVTPLRAVERDIRATAATDAAVAEWVREIDITYSFVSRDIAGSPTRSHHAFGMAIDFVPTSYDGLQVYWRWSRVFNREGWDGIPLAERWSPPQAVLRIFEQHGFVWGGKWAHFDVIHFEYRPEIILYNRMVTRAAG
jgi:hypothetical protein